MMGAWDLHEGWEFAGEWDAPPYDGIENLTDISFSHGLGEVSVILDRTMLGGPDAVRSVELIVVEDTSGATPLPDHALHSYVDTFLTAVVDGDQATVDRLLTDPADAPDDRTDPPVRPGGFIANGDETRWQLVLHVFENESWLWVSPVQLDVVMQGGDHGMGHFHSSNNDRWT